MAVAALPQLRPRGIGELLDQAIRLYRKNFLKLIGIVALIQIPVTLLQMLGSLLAFGGILAPEWLGNDPFIDPAGLGVITALFGGGISVVVGLLGFLLIQGLAAGALSRAVAGSYLGETVGIVEAYRKIGPVWLSLVLAMLLTMALGIGLLIWTLVPCVGWLTGFGMMTFLWVVIVPLIAPIVVIEKQGPIETLRRAWDLSRRRFWGVLGFIFILFMFNLLVVSGPVAILGIFFQFAMESNMEVSPLYAMLQVSLQAIIQLATSLLYLPLQFVAVLLLYFDLRIRTEGFDLALGSREEAGAPLLFDELAVGAPQPQQGNWITMAEMGNFALMELGVVGIYFIVVFLFVGLIFGLGAAAGF